MNQKSDSLKTFALWLAALFLMAVGAHLWMAWLYASPLPMWDQWYEALFFKSWVAGDLKVADFFAGNNEHRVVLTRVLDLGVIWANGRWEPLLQVTVNAFIFGLYACELAYFLWDFLGRKQAWLVCLLLAPFMTLPFTGENATWGFNSQQYFVNVLGLPALVWLGFAKFGSWRWYGGCLAAVLGLFTMANGLLAPVAVGGVLVLRMIKNRRAEKGQLISLAAAVVVFAIGAALNVTKEQDHSLQAHSFVEFTAALTRDLSWPFYNAPVMPCFIGLPLALLLVVYLRPKFEQTRAAEFLLALALWSVLQAVVLAYGRANYGEGVPASRYMDWIEILVIAGIFSAVLLAQLWERRLVLNSVLAGVYIVVIVAGLCQMSRVVVNGLLVPTRLWQLVAEERVERWAATENDADFLERPTVRPDAPMALRILRDKDIQTIFPAIGVPPAIVYATPERLMPLSGWLQRHSPWILAVGLGLFIGLCSYGLARGTVAFAAKSPMGIIALVAGLAALGYVWTIRNVSRQSVDYALQTKIVANFKAAGNFKRAAIHEEKAEELKRFAN